MKKAFLYFFVACLIVSCKQGDNGKNIFTQQKNNNTTNSTWSKDFSTKFMSDCVTSASAELGQAQAQTYCSCMQDKISKKYPDENDAQNKMTKEDVESLKGGCLGNQTNNNPNQNNPNQNNPNQNNPNQNNPYQTNPNQTYPNQNNPNQKQWSNDDQGAFLQTCVTSAIKRMDGGAATQLCDCIMQKLMQKFPTRQAADNAYTPEYNAELQRECAGTGMGKK